MSDNPEVVASEQHDGIDTSLRGQTFDDQRDQTDVLLPKLVQDRR